MLIDGLQKVTLLDYPGKIAATIFTFGCNFCCGFCHNPHLVKSELRQVNPEYTEKKILEFLKSRNDFLEGAVITGGEPTLQDDLPDFIKKIRVLNFLVKVDTNGTEPQMIEELIKKDLVNFWAMDIKNAPHKYEDTVSRPVSVLQIQKSINLIKNSGNDYEFRTTIVESLHTPEDILDIARWLEGSKKLVLQKFIPREQLVDQKFVTQKSFSVEVLQKLAKKCEEWVGKCEVR